MAANLFVRMSGICLVGAGLTLRHAVCEIDSKYRSFSSDLGLHHCRGTAPTAKPLQNKVVLVTGGAGFLGQHIIKTLQEKAPHVKEIRIFDRKPFVNQLDYEARKPMCSLVGDICDREEVNSALQGVDAVIHTAGLVSFGTFPDVAAMEEVNVKGTQNVIDGCIGQGVKYLIYTSTVDVVIGFDDIANGNETLPAPEKFLFPGYPDTKYRAETNVLSTDGTKLKPECRGHIRTLALRPNVMYGELDPFYVTSGLQNASRRGGILHRIGDGGALFQQAYVGNVAWGHVLALEALERSETTEALHPGGHAFFLTDDTPLMNTFRFMEPFLASKGMVLSRRALPYALVYFLLWPAEKLAHLLEPMRKIELPTQLCSLTYVNRTLYFNRAKAERMLHYSPLYTYEQAMEKCLPYYAALDLKFNKRQDFPAGMNLPPAQPVKA